MRRSAPRVSIIVPVYNEETNIESCVRRLSACMRSRRVPSEILAVDDGSTDATPRLLRNMSATIPALRVVRTARHRGKGSAVRAGFAAARGRFVVFTDCDLSTPPSQIPRAIGALQRGCDVVIGSRNLPGSRLPVPQPFLRRLAGRAFNFAVRILLGLRYADTQCGFKAFTARAARSLARSAKMDGFAFDVELLLLARRLGFTVGEIPIVWSDNPDTKIRLLRHSPGMFRAVMSLKRRFADVITYHPARALPLILASCMGAVLGQIFYKQGANAIGEMPIGPEFIAAMASNHFIWYGLAFFSMSAVTWIMALARVDLSFAFPMLSLNFVFTALYAWLFFGEHLGVNRVAGISLVIVGVLAIAASGRSPQRGTSKSERRGRGGMVIRS